MSIAKLAAAALFGTVALGGPAHADQWVGEISHFGSATCPKGWVEVKGQQLAVVHYPELYSVIRHLFGGQGAVFDLPHHVALTSSNGRQEIECIAATGRYPTPIK